MELRRPRRWLPLLSPPPSLRPSALLLLLLVLLGPPAPAPAFAQGGLSDDLLLTAEGSGAASADASAPGTTDFAVFDGADAAAAGGGGSLGGGGGGGGGLIQVRGVARPSPPPPPPQPLLEVTSVSATVSRTSSNRSVSSRGPVLAPPPAATPGPAHPHGHGHAPAPALAPAPGPATPHGPAAAPEAREALSHASSEQQQVVLAAEAGAYLPVRRPLDDGDWPGDWDARAPLGLSTHGWRPNTTRVQHIEAECQDDYMKIRIGFNGSFHGLLYSSGYAYDPDCVYVNGSGRDYYEFYIQLNRCGTLGRNALQEGRSAPSKNFMWNTVTVQYNPLIEEDWDEHFKVTCEYGYDFWKTVTFPFLDVEVATGNPVVFTLSPPECYMEIRHGYGTAGQRVAGPVRVGDPLTLLIYMRSRYDGFDLVVSDCVAHNGAAKRIQLIDQYGCPVDDKLISRFRGSWSEGGVFETQVFAYLKTFRFTGSPALYIECDVRMCHGRCPTQPCHWRNAKAVARRSADAAPGTDTEAANAALRSENVSLFQALRVLQEGESSEDAPHAARGDRALAEPGNVCMRAGAFAALAGLGCALLGVLTLALAGLCCRLRGAKAVDATDPRALDRNAFLTHKGRIN